jgi:mono/diheme cytochrome c family protein
MFKRTASVLIVLFLVFSFIGLALAQDEGNPRKGKYLFRKNCRSCHGSDGSATELSPITKTQAQWDTVFQASDQLKCAAEWQKLSEKDLGDMHAYLWGHAYDSPSPAKCK